VVAIGTSAALQNNGTSVVAIGLSAAQNLASCSSSVAVGPSALQSGNSSALSVAVGSEAGFQINSAPGAVLVGRQAGRDSTGDYPAAFGFQSLRNNTGDNVSAVGRGAGYNNTGSDCVFIGKYAGTNSGLTGTNTQSNRFVISNDNLPSFVNHAAALAAITVPLGAVAGNTYLYHNQATDSIGAVRL
jgi:hypothetical protein